MRVCVIGAGAIGGLMGAKLALAGNEVSVIDQGPHLQAIRQNGLKLIWEDGSEHVAQVKAYEKCADAGEQDLVILGLKAHYLELVAKEMEPLMGPDTMIMTATSAAMGIWRTQSLKNSSNSNKKMPALSVDRRPRPPDFTLMTDCPIIAQPAIPPRKPLAMLATPCPMHSRLLLLVVSVRSSTMVAVISDSSRPTTINVMA